jgi:hypothetical protein
MAFPTVTTASPANIKPAAIVAVFAADSTTNKWQTLGSIGGGVLNIQDFSSPDTLNRNLTNGAFKFTAKVNMKQCSLTELELLDSITSGTNAFLFKLADAEAIPTGGSTATAGWMKVTAAQVGVKGRVVGSGTPEDNRHIELDFQGTAILSAKDGVVKAAIDDNEFASSADSATAPYYAIGTYTAALDGGSPKNANLKPCGVASITLTDNAGGSPVTMSPIQNVKIELDQLSTEDDLLRFLPCAMRINVEFDWMATDAADLLLLDGMVVLAVNPIITMLDGVVITLANQTGIETNLEASGGMEKNRIVRFTCKGDILNSSFDGIVS